MTGTDLIQIGSGLGAGIAGTLIAVIKYYERKHEPAKHGNGHLTKAVFVEEMSKLGERVERVIRETAKDAHEGHREHMQQLAGSVARDVKIIVLEHVAK